MEKNSSDHCIRCYEKQKLGVDRWPVVLGPATVRMSFKSPKHRLQGLTCHMSLQSFSHSSPLTGCHGNCIRGNLSRSRRFHGESRDGVLLLWFPNVCLSPFCSTDFAVIFLLCFSRVSRGVYFFTFFRFFACVFSQHTHCFRFYYCRPWKRWRSMVTFQILKALNYRIVS